MQQLFLWYVAQLSPINLTRKRGLAACDVVATCVAATVVPVAACAAGAAPVVADHDCVGAGAVVAACAATAHVGAACVGVAVVVAA